MSERRCYGGLHALDCPHVRMVAEAAVAAILPRIERLERSAEPHWHYVNRAGQMSNRNERMPR